MKGAEDRRNNELVLSEGQYLYCSDTTKGVTVCYTGPKIITVSGQEYPVVFEQETRKLRLSTLEDAVQHNILVPQGQYVEVVNPPKDSKFPDDNSKQNVPELQMGEKVNIQGPISFALWPMTSARVIVGHQLRSNEYLLLRVYDEASAKDNWDSAIIKPVTDVDSEGEKKNKPTAAKTNVVAPKGSEVNPNDFVVGKLFIIKGTEVSYFIPPTGVEVLKDENDEYVRQALTLTSLQYCILLDESGDKTYQTGPNVVFPKPTEVYVTMTDRDGNSKRIFAPIELSLVQGIHVKVIEAYKEGDKEHKKGEELFLTGETTPIYFPRHEHSIIRYDGKDKHYAIAVPSEGEARYIMVRNTGKILMKKGPGMLLPDPRTEVVVRRVLSNKECTMMYPGNTEALAYNSQLRELSKKSPTTRKGVVSDGEYARALTKNTRRSKKPEPERGGTHVQASYSNSVEVMADMAMDLSRQNHDNKAMMPDQFTRGSTYSEPRAITMDNKFAGVPTVGLYNGYAVMIVNKKGDRRVEVGPKTILLEYDETLEVLSFSTGKPKNTGDLHHTVYLKEKNNQISDKVYAETGDHVEIEILMSYRVNFEGDKPKEQQKWFEVENYVKMLCDHARSKLKAKIRQFTIDDFYSKSTDIIRDSLLGVKKEKGGRGGLLFLENNMRLHDVEVLGVQFRDSMIASKMKDAQVTAVLSAITTAKERKLLEVRKVQEDIKRQTIIETEKTKIAEVGQQKADITRAKGLKAVEHDKRLDDLEKTAADNKLVQATADENLSSELARISERAKVELEGTKGVQDLKIDLLNKETEAAVKKMESVGQHFAEAIAALQNEKTMVSVAEASAINSWMGVDNMTEVMKGTPFEAKFQTIVEKALKNKPKALQA